MGVASSSIFASTGFAIEYMTDDETWTINPGVVASSTENRAVFSAHDRSALINHGNVFSGNGFAAYFLGVGNAIVNAAGATIAGLDGILLEGGTSIDNAGSISGFGTSGIRYSVTAGDVVINNKGEIYGLAAAISANSLGEGGTINNDGLIRSGHLGIVVATFAEGEPTVIKNAKSGTIEGVDAAIVTILLAGILHGAIDLKNRGTIIGDIDCNAEGASDKVVNKGKIKGDVELGPGNDVFAFAGGKQGTVLGEAGADQFSFVSKLATKKKAAAIGDFTPGEDTIGLSKALFKGLGKEGPLKEKYFEVGKKAKDKDDRVISDQANGNLFYDRDGSGNKHKPVLVAQLDENPKLNASDFIVEA